MEAQAAPPVQPIPVLQRLRPTTSFPRNVRSFALDIEGWPESALYSAARSTQAGIPGSLKLLKSGVMAHRVGESDSARVWRIMPSIKRRWWHCRSQRIGIRYITGVPARELGTDLFMP